MGVYGIVMLNIFSSGILVILILMCSIVESSSPAECDFAPFWLTVFVTLHGKTYTNDLPLNGLKR